MKNDPHSLKPLTDALVGGFISFVMFAIPFLILLWSYVIINKISYYFYTLTMTVTTNERGQQNLFAKEPTMYTAEVTETAMERAEKANGRWAMLGVIAAIGAYATTGQLIPGIFWTPLASGRSLLLLSLFSGLSPMITMTMMSQVVG